MKDVAGTTNPDMFYHEHEGEDGRMYACYDPVCDNWVWTDPKIQAQIPNRFQKLVSKKRDFRLLQIALLVRTIENQEIQLGPMANVGGRRIKLKPLIAAVLAMVTAYGLGAVTKSWMLRLIFAMLF